MRWAEKVKQECEDVGYTFTKRGCDGHWEMRDELQVIHSSRSLGDILRKAGNELGIGV